MMHIIKKLLKQNSAAQPSNRRGAMMVLLCVMLFAFMATVALSVDIAYMQLVRTEMRTATDAAAKAASESLARTQSVGAAIAQGKLIARENQVAGTGLQLSSGDFQFGRSEANAQGKFVFSRNGTPTNSVRVTASRSNNSLSGGVNLFFGRVFGVNTFEPNETATATFLERDVIVVLDRSGSMSGGKIADLKRAIQTFVSVLSQNTVEEHIGIASYSTFSSQDLQMTPQINLAVSTVNNFIASGSTNITAGMRDGLSIISRGRSPNFVERTMIVMTDGIHNTGIGPESIAPTIAAQGIKIHTITFGNDADQARMARIAATGNGKHFHAVSGTQLEQVFRDIALTLSTLVTE